MWSVGCIFAELMLRRPFFPGDNYIDQLTIICDKLGKPKEEELTFVSTEKAGPADSCCYVVVDVHHAIYKSRATMRLSCLRFYSSQHPGCKSPRQTGSYADSPSTATRVPRLRQPTL